MNSSVNILVGLVVLVWLLSRQVQKRLVQQDRKPAVLLILLVLGALQLTTLFKDSRPDATVIVLVVVSLAIAAGFGVVRAYTVKLWRADGQLWRQGTWVTLVLWIAAIGIHFGMDFVIDGASGTKGIGSASILLYLAVSLGAQRLVVQSRASRLIRA
ncbi:hypothetical protein [Amycolatopsis sp. H20-H5]|uniref:hypothetical protein n=1 Tax=Amycolatopsis sp. H20-H5 TaxID=3046309 RepID=UPI002DB8B2F7|nr:hypothetical protein [Amycolatopsis sp. H20-H5]MEC3978833.1 hypothetical protein [Amycolatopsis sp. H20-H5]